jgi:hypothetical protein
MEDEMKKLRLPLDGLEVESFDTGDAPGERGTVHAHYPLSNQHCNSEWSCRDTCYFYSCYDTDCGCNPTYDVACDMSYYEVCNTAGTCLGMETCMGGDQLC